MNRNWMVQEAYNLLESLNFEDSGLEAGDSFMVYREDRRHRFVVDKDGIRHIESHSSNGILFGLGNLREAFNRKAAAMIAYSGSN